MNTLFKPLSDAIGRAIALFRSLDGLTRACFFGILVLAPFAVLPFSGTAVVTSQYLFITVLVVIAVIALILKSLKKGALFIPQTPFVGSLILLMIVVLASAAASRAFRFNIIGYGTEPSTVFFIFLWALLIMISASTVRSVQSVRRVIRGIVFVGTFFLVWQSGLILFPSLFNAGILPTFTASLFGSFYDLSILIGLLLLFAVLLIEFRRPLSSWGRIGLIAIITLSTVFLLVASFNVIWIILGLIAIALCVYFYAFNPGATGNRRFPVTVALLAFLSIIGLVAGPDIQNKVNQYRSVGYVEVYASPLATAKTFAKSVMKNPVVGTGPNTFSSIFPQANAVKENAFGIKTVQSGIGYIPTIAATTGILGLLVVLYMLFALSKLLFKKGFSNRDSDERRSLWMYRFMLSIAVLYLMVLSIIHFSGILVLVLLAIVIGSLVGYLITEGNIRLISISLLGSRKKSLVVISLAFVLMIFTFYSGYTLMKRYTGLVRFSTGLSMISQGNTIEGIRVLETAHALANTDTNNRVLANIAINRLREAGQNFTDAENQTQKDLYAQQAQQYATAAQFYAAQARNYNQYGFQNWQFLGDVYRVLTQYGFAGAYDQARIMYDAAQARNPFDTTMALNYAGLEFSKGDVDKAKEVASETLTNPTKSAYLFLYQLALANNNSNDAKASLEKVVSIDPRDYTSLYNLGVLYFRSGEYGRAETVLKQSIGANRNFFDPYLLLGLTLEREGKQSDANTVYQFLRQQVSNADEIISRVKQSLNQSNTVEESDSAIKSTSN